MPKIRRSAKDLRERAARLVWAREALDLDQAELARFLEISPQRLNNYESGLRPLDVDLALAMVQRWPDLDLKWFYDGDERRLGKEFAEKIAERRAAQGKAAAPTARAKR
jgi:transcriptional regulator with XRE-family HTH domain